MTESNKIFTPGVLAFIGLCKEYCVAVASASASEQRAFVDTMLRLLPRIYISANDLSADALSDGAYLDDYLTEQAYVNAQNEIAALLGEYDVYLDVFEEDMKYSDTPVSATVSEGLCDLLQELYNFLETVRDTTDSMVLEAISAVVGDFKERWSLTLCNVFRALNQIRNNLELS